jgi:hypothetical protein
MSPTLGVDPLPAGAGPAARSGLAGSGFGRINGGIVLPQSYGVTLSPSALRSEAHRR